MQFGGLLKTYIYVGNHPSFWLCAPGYFVSPDTEVILLVLCYRVVLPHYP